MADNSRSFGGIGEFRLDQNVSWASYKERVEFYFEAHGITEDTIKRAIFLASCGEFTYNKVRSLVTPKTPRDVTFTEICVLLDGHFTPRPNEIVQRFHFYNRVQQEGESAADFVAGLRNLSEYCEFADLNKSLRDRLVCGVYDEAIQQRLLAEKTLTFEMAFDIVVAAETAKKNVSHIRGGRQDWSHGQDGVHEIRHTDRNVGEQKKTVTGRKVCYRCGGTHLANVCKFVNTICNFCKKKKGHVERVCFEKKRRQAEGFGIKGEAATSDLSMAQNNLLEETVESLQEYQGGLYRVSGEQMESTCPMIIQVRLNGREHKMEIDTGAARTIISEATYQTLWQQKPQLERDSVQLQTWSKETLQALGTMMVEVEYEGRMYKLKLTVMKGKGQSLIGRDWFGTLGFYVGGLHAIMDSAKHGYLAKFKSLFSNDLGEYKGQPVTVKVDATTEPIFKKSRPIPFAMKEKVCEELDRLTKIGVLEPVRYSRWATPIVPIVKKDGNVRICGDYKCTVNLAMETDTYPLPTMNEAFASLAGGKLFTKLDLQQAYTQIKVDKEAADILTWNTPKGLYRVNRLPFGVKSAPGIFQRLMATQLADIGGVVVLLDDILVSGGDKDEHWGRVEAVLQRLDEAGLRLKVEKCIFASSSVTFLGFRVDNEGIHPTEEKVIAIHGAPEPQNKTELQAFLGLYNFYERFLPGKASVLEPLHRLLDKHSTWKWEGLHKEAFQRAKMLLMSDAVLTHYEADRALVLVCDASPWGVGAVLAHIMDDGSEKPIAYGSRTLQKHERNYAQIDREALAMIFGVCKFRQYIYGRSCTIMTDHKPLLGLLHPERQTPAVMSPRMLRWSIMLSAYDYKLEYRPGPKVANADGLSRLPMIVPEQEIPELGDVLLLQSTEGIPFRTHDIVQAAGKDPVLSKVMEWVAHGWPEANKEEQFAPYWSRRAELSIYKECLLWGNRVVIPNELRAKVLKMLHVAHQGIVYSKAIARSYVWWPKMDRDIEMLVRSCSVCQEFQNNPPKGEILPWSSPTEPWSRLHVDFAGPFLGKTFLILVDAFSGWPEIELVSSMTAAVVVGKLRKMFATHGLPDVIVSDNGTAFTAEECNIFFKRNGIRHIRTAPFHPATNGHAERMVQTLKKMIKKTVDNDWETNLARTLFALRTTPRATTGKSPAEMLMGRQLRSGWHKIHPKSTEKQEVKIEETKVIKGRTFELGEAVSVRNYTSRGKKWLPGFIVEVKGPCSYNVKLVDGRFFRRHRDQIMRRVGPLQAVPRMGEQVELGQQGDTEVTQESPTPVWGEMLSQKGDPGAEVVKGVELRAPVLLPESGVPTAPIQEEVVMQKGMPGESDKTEELKGSGTKLRQSGRKCSAPKHLKDFEM